MNPRRAAVQLAAIAIMVACSDNLSAIPTGFYGDLSQDQETPPVVTTGTGTATFTVFGPATPSGRSPGDSLRYTITAANLTSTWLFAHIHTGAPGVNGGVQVNLCGTGTPAPACPASTGGTVSGTATVKTGGISFDSLYVLMKTGGAYVNYHTANNGGGEIRGIVLMNPLP